MPKHTDHSNPALLGPAARRRLAQAQAEAEYRRLAAVAEAAERARFPSDATRTEQANARHKRRPRNARKAPGQYTRIRPSRFPHTPGPKESA